MGLFKPDYEKPQITEWYYSEKGRKAYEKANSIYKTTGSEYGKQMFFYYYILSLPNIKYLVEKKFMLKSWLYRKLCYGLQNCFVKQRRVF